VRARRARAASEQEGWERGASGGAASQAGEHLRGGLRALLGAAGEQGVDDGGDGLGDEGGALPKGRGGDVDLRPEGREDGGPGGDRGLAGEGEVEHDAEGVEVGAGGDVSALDLLGREEERRAEDLPLARALRVEGLPAHAEVEEGGAPLRADEHVAGLEVAVDHPRRVDAREGLEEGGDRGSELLPGEGRGAAWEGGSVDALHDEEDVAVVDALVEQGDHAGHAEATQGGDLATHPGPLGEGAGVHHLHGDAAAGERVVGLPDLGLAAGAEHQLEDVATGDDAGGEGSPAGADDGVGGGRRRGELVGHEAGG
jgi:hypothetical protein